MRFPAPLVINRESHYTEYMLTERQQLILRYIVDDYIHDAAPISSESLARRHRLGVSPATVRNEVAALEERGFISRPHPSAGSVPDDRAYRLYVESCLADAAPRVPSRARAAASSRFMDVQDDIDRWGSAAAAVLAQLIGNLGIATPPRTAVSRVRHLELIPVRDVLALLIVVMEQAKLRKQLLRFDRPVAADELESMSVRIRARALGLSRREIADRSLSDDDDLSGSERKALDAAMDILKAEDAAQSEDHFASGIRNLLDQPEFADYRIARPIIRGIEDGDLIAAALDEAPAGQIIRVVIGREHRGEALKPLSVVICRYGIPGRALGSVGALGPTRMEYARAISGVALVSSIMNSMVESLYTE